MNLRTLELRLEEAGQDVEQLRALARAVEFMPEHRLFALRIGARITAARKQHPEIAPTPPALAPLNIGAPDGRWLYQYDIGEDGFGHLEQAVRTAALGQKLEAGWNPGLFVLWASHWFRRNHPGGLRRWEDLSGSLTTELPQSSWRNLTLRGLRLWKRNVIRGESHRYFLSTLAREGGFPSAALSDGQNSWATGVIARIVAALLSESQVDDDLAFQLARSQLGSIPAVFADDDFLRLCADLAVSIVSVRREADPLAAQAGIPAAAWLDANSPGWRGRIPLSGSAAPRLLDELMAVRAHRISKGFVEASRYLALIDGVWKEALQLDLDGEPGSAVDRLIPRDKGRLSIFAGKQLGRYIPGEIAETDPGDGEPAWFRAIQRRSILHQVPFSCPIELDLRASGRNLLRLRLSNGNPVRHPMQIFSVARRRDNVPVELLFRGQGSGRYVDARIVICVPEGWSVCAMTDDESVIRWGCAPAGTALWEVVEGALVTDGNGDLHRVLCNQSTDRLDEFEIAGGSAPDCLQLSDSKTILITAPVQIRLLTSKKTLDATGRVFVREAGCSGWRALTGAVPTGHIELAWLEGGFVRASCSLAVLPANGTVEIAGRGSSRVRYRTLPAGSWSLRVGPEAPVRSIAPSGDLIGTARAAVTREFPADIVWHCNSATSSLPVKVRFPCGAGLADWNGRRILPDTPIALGSLRDFLAYADGPMDILGRLMDERGRAVPGTEMRWSFENEVPLAVLEDELRDVLAPAGVGASVQLDMLDGQEQRWRIYQFDPALSYDGRRLFSARGVVEKGSEIRVRALVDYTREVVAGVYSLDDDLNHRPVDLPPSVAGPFIAYLRSDRRILSQPVLAHAGCLPVTGGDILSRAMVSGDFNAAEHFLTQAADEAECAASAIAALVRLTASLDGVPPAAFGVLAGLPSFPLVLVRMLGSADEDSRACVLGLSQSLPFAWYLIPHMIWQQGLGEAMDAMRSRLERQGVPDADRHFAAMVQGVRECLEVADPVAHRLIFPPPASELTDIAQAFLNRHVNEAGLLHGSIFREAGIKGLPDYFLSLPSHCLETLDAPCAAAAAARGEWRPDPVHVARIKSVNRRFPDYFGDAFSASVRHKA